MSTPRVSLVAYFAYTLRYSENADIDAHLSSEPRPPSLLSYLSYFSEGGGYSEAEDIGAHLSTKPRPFKSVALLFFFLGGGGGGVRMSCMVVVV